MDRSLAQSAETLARPESVATAGHVLLEVDEEAHSRRAAQALGAPRGGIERVLIIGGGVSGLALACGLARLGITVDVVEKNKRTSGSGIGLWGFAIRAFEMLGLKEELLRTGAMSQELASFDGRGAPKRVVPFDEVTFGLDQPPQLAVSRPALAEMLERNALERGVRIRNECTVLWAHDHGERVTVQLTDGDVSEYDLVVGADGAFSSTRRDLLMRTGEPNRSDAGNWQTTVPADRVGITRPTVYFHDDMAFFLYPSGSTTTFVGVNDRMAERPVSREAADLRVKDRLGQFEVEPARALIDLINEKAVEFEFRRIHSMLVTPPWYRGRTVLVGDAAHAAPPNLGGGASMAVEDAAVLTDAIRRGRTVEGILTEYMERRWSRVQTVFTRSYQVYMNPDRELEEYFSIHSPVLREVLQGLANEP